MDDVVTTVAILAALCAIYRRQCRRVRQISEMRRKGLTVENNNTDAEGRLVLADALALADEETPDLLITQ